MQSWGHVRFDSAGSVVASTGYELVISCAQDVLPVSARLETWSAQPAETDEPDWSALQVFELECPTGHVVIGSPTGEVLGTDLPARPGIYALDIVHQAGEQALAARRDALGMSFRHIWHGYPLPRPQ